MATTSVATATAAPPTFLKKYAEFIGEMKLTFPEFTEQLVAAAVLPDAEKRFVALWKPYTTYVATQNGAMFLEAGIEILPGVKMTKALWSELSAGTKAAIWKYISTLLLLAATDSATAEEGFWDLSGFQHDMEEMMKMLKESGEDGKGIFGGMDGIFAKISEMAKSFGLDAKDLSGASAKFKLPERLFKGHIAKIAEELVKEFKPEDFGISPEMLESDDPAKVFNYLQEIFTKKPEMLMVSAQKIAKKIQAKFARGEIKREEIIREAEELMKEFSENDAFSSLFGSLGEMLKSSEKETGNEGSARRREVQERLRRKQAEKAAARAAGGAGSTASNLLAADAASAEAAAAAFAELMREEEAAKAAAAAKKPAAAPKNKKK